MKTAVSIPDRQFRAADRLAKRLGLSRSELYQAALADYLSNHEEDLITERLNKVHTDRPEPSRIPEDIAWMQARSIPNDKW